MKCETCGESPRLGADCSCEQPDYVNHPSHYADQYPFEVIDVIESILNLHCQDLTPFESYCVGNMLKYKLRAGAKGDPLEDIRKAFKYREFYAESMSKR